MNYLNDHRLRAEFFGTLCLVLIGCASVVATGFGGAFPLGILGIGMAFGMTFTVMVYTIGPVSGCHINPAVTAAMWSAGRVSTADAIAYVVAQIIGAIVGALVLYLLMKGRISGTITALGQTTWGPFGAWAAIAAEFIGAFIFTTVILAVTGPRGAGPIAGLVIGLTLMVAHFALINISGASLNGARSFGPALFVGGTALAQVWMYLIVPTLGGLAAGWLVKSKTLDV
jgi:aquaporin Z